MTRVYSPTYADAILDRLVIDGTQSHDYPLDRPRSMA